VGGQLSALPNRLRHQGMLCSIGTSNDDSDVACLFKSNLGHTFHAFEVAAEEKNIVQIYMLGDAMW
jgi:hypothetical protein